MFTGIVQRARVAASEPRAGGLRLRVEAPAIAAASALGDSVSVGGVCLTVTALDGSILSFDVVPESLARSTLGRLRAGAAVNVEAALRAGEPLGGHYVQGHVDGVATVRSADDAEAGRSVWFDPPRELLRYVARKGSVAVEGVSLTIADLDDRGFATALVPHTLAETTLGELAAGDAVNLEVDVLAKYVERLLPQDGR